jgi:hypothetical protein
MAACTAAICQKPRPLPDIGKERRAEARHRRPRRRKSIHRKTDRSDPQDVPKASTPGPQISRPSSTFRSDIKVSTIKRRYGIHYGFGLRICRRQSTFRCLTSDTTSSTLLTAGTRLILSLLHRYSCSSRPNIKRERDLRVLLLAMGRLSSRLDYDDDGSASCHWR